MSKIFWKDGFEGKASGGYHFRVFDLEKFFMIMIMKYQNLIKPTNHQFILIKKKRKDNE